MIKQQIREQKLLERLNHHPQIKERKNKKIVTKLLQLPEFKNAKKILIYLPIKGEFDPSSLLTKKSLNKFFILPRVANKEGKLDLYYVKNLEDVEKGSFNILEPKLHLKIAKPKDLDLAIIPGIAFSQNGHRIGYGKGFYDRLLKKINCPKIGVAYDFQIVDNIAGQEHDVPLNAIITEEKIIRISDFLQGAKKRSTHKTKNIL